MRNKEGLVSLFTYREYFIDTVQNVHSDIRFIENVVANLFKIELEDHLRRLYAAERDCRVIIRKIGRLFEKYIEEDEIPKGLEKETRAMISTCYHDCEELTIITKKYRKKYNSFEEE